MTTMRKALIATAVGMAMAGTANAGSVLFDVNGAAGANTTGVDRFVISTFDWAPGNLLVRDTAPSGSEAASPVTIYSQSVLTGLLLSGGGSFAYGGPFPGQLTYQMRTFATASDDGNNIQYDPFVSASSFLEIYYAPTLLANDITGCGFGANGCGPNGTLIYRGTANMTAGTSGTMTQTGSTVSLLDQSSDGTGNAGATLTRNLNLTPLSLDVDTITFDPTFFISDISSLPTDIQQSGEGGAAPFKAGPNPSDQVVGVTPDYGLDGINNIGAGSCGTAAENNSPCDVHVQNDASSSVLTHFVPEPASLALLGLGLAGLGATLRRRAKRSLS